MKDGDSHSFWNTGRGLEGRLWSGRGCGRGKRPLSSCQRFPCSEAGIQDVTFHRRYGYVPRKGAVGQVEAGNENAIDVETPFVSKNGCLEPIGASDGSVDEWNGYLPAANFYLPMI